MFSTVAEVISSSGIEKIPESVTSIFPHCLGIQGHSVKWCCSHCPLLAATVGGTHGISPGSTYVTMLPLAKLRAYISTRLFTKLQTLFGLHQFSH